MNKHIGKHTTLGIHKAGVYQGWGLRCCRLGFERLDIVANETLEELDSVSATDLYDSAMRDFGYFPGSVCTG